MPFKVSDEEKPKFNKRVQESFTLLSEQLEDVAFQGAASEEPAIELDSIRDADGNIISNSLDLFSTPLNGDKSKALGLVDADGNATDKGELFFNMKEAGMFDDTGVITDKGRAYLMKPIDLKDPKNLPAFTQLWDDGVIRGDETTWEQKGEALMGFGGNILGGIGEMGSNFGKNLYYQLDNRKGFGIPYLRSEENDNTPEWLKAENVAVNLSVGEKIATNLMEIGRMVDVASATFETSSMPSDPRFASIGRPSPIQSTPQREDVKVDDQKLYASRQRQWAMRETLKDLEVGEVAEMITEVKGIVDEAEKAKEVIGEERFKKIVERTGATTEMFGSPENLIPASFALNLGKLVPLGNRASIGAQKVLSKVLIKEAEIGALETSLEAAKLTVEKGAISNRLTSRFIEEGAAVGATPVAISRGEKAAEIAARTAKITDEATAAIPRLTSNLDEAVKLRNSLSTRIPETAANATLKTLEAGRQLRGLPAKAIGGALEGFGNTLTKIDGSISNFLKERGLDQMYSAALGAAGVVGVAGSPVIGAIGAGAAALKAGKMITNYGKLFKYVGKEMVKVKGQIPFWKRVAAHTEAGSLNRAIAHSFNMLDLGGVTSDTLRRIPRGIAAAAPSDLMFEWLSDGADMRPETLYQALAESVYIGGSFAAAGGAFMGTKTRMRQLAIGDQLNFNQSLTDPRQKVLYNQLDPGTRNSIATYSIANPTLNYVFKDNGASNYDPNTNTATINVRSNNSIKPLIAHETLHHTIIKNNMEAGISALFLGDTVNNTVGGLLRSKDGKLDPNFKAFTDAYYQRLRAGGMTDAEINATYPLDKIAVEYFIEQHSDQYAGMAESGELGAIAASGDIKRKLSGVLETVLPRIPVLRDLHFKSGGMIDKDGSWVTGNGILDAGGVKTNPITNKMFRDMNRRSSGLAPGQFEPLVSDKQDSGAQLSLDPSSPIDSELLHPLIKVDENGSPILVDGKPVALDKATLLERALGGLTAKEVLRRKKADNYIPEKGEAHIDDLGEFQPGWLSNDVLSEMFAKNRYNPEQKRIIREMNRMIRKGDGGRAVMINFPATTRNKAGKVVYKAQGATLRDTVPVAITISKDGNLLFGLMSVNKLQENIQKRSQSRRGKKLYGGNVDLILRDTQAMMQFHKDGVDSIEYFKEKYGAVEATERKNFINTMFGLLNQKEQAVLNPMLVEDGVKSRDNVYRTYRADRVSKAVAMSPDDYPAMPFSYEAVSQVKMPEQSRQMPEKPITSSSEEWKSMSNKEKDAYVFAPAEMTPSNKAEFNARVESGSLSADTPVVDINRSNLLTSKYGPPSSSATGNINTWIDDNTGKPVAVAFSEYGNIPTKGGWNPNPIKATNEVAKAKGIPNKITENIFNLLKDKPISVGMADLLGAGGKVRGISVTGGPGYPVQMFDPQNPSKITAVWASQEQGVRGILQNMEKTNSIWKDESGHHWAIYSPHTMKQGAHKSNAQTPLIYVSKINKMAERGALTKETAIEISNHIRKNVASAKDMPDIGSRKLEKFINDASFETRADIMNELTTTRSKEIGAPAPESVLTESRDIQYQGVEKNALTSLLLIDIDRMAIQNAKGKWELRKDLKASDFGVEAHPSYDTVMPGRILAHFDNPVPFDVATPKMVSTMFKASPKSRPDYLLTKLPPNKGVTFQPLTKEVMEAINSVQDIKGNVPYIREVVKAGTGNWKRFSSKDSQAGLKEFTFAIERSPAKESLTQYDYKDVQKMIKRGELEVHQLGENDIWFGVKKTKSGNDLVSVVNNTGIPGMLNVIMARAIEAGVNTLDASSVITSKTPNGLLPTLYERYGWKETGRDKFDRKYLVERNKSDTKAQHEAKIAQKEAALKMFWEEQGWDGKTMPDIVYMKLEGKTNGKQTGPVINEYGESLASRKIGSIGSTSKATAGEVRGSGLSRGQGQGSVGGTPAGTTRADSGVLPRGFDSVVETIRSASDIQLKSMGLTVAEKKKFLDRFDK